MEQILLVMCPQNSFFDPKGSVYMGEKAETLKVRLEDYMGSFPGRKIFFREKHGESDDFFSNDKTHSIVNSFDFNVYDSFKKYADIFYDKTRYSAVFNTGFEIFLKKEKISMATIVGVETHTSVLFTAEEVRYRGIEVSIVEPLLASRDDYMHGYAVSLMTNFLGVRINA
jgi:nicotinamidase-related amidase